MGSIRTVRSLFSIPALSSLIVGFYRMTEMPVHRVSILGSSNQNVALHIDMHFTVTFVDGQADPARSSAWKALRRPEI